MHITYASLKGIFLFNFVFNSCEEDNDGDGEINDFVGNYDYNCQDPWGDGQGRGDSIDYYPGDGIGEGYDVDLVSANGNGELAFWARILIFEESKY